MDNFFTHVKNILGIILKYLKASIIDGFIIGAINYIFLYAMEMPWKIAISILMGVTNLVPSVGPAVGAVIAGVVFAFYDIKQALWFLGFTVVLQTIDGFYIKPKLFGESFGVPSIVMLVAMIVSGAIFGVVGLIVVVPVVAIAKYLIKHVFFNKEKDTPEENQ